MVTYYPSDVKRCEEGVPRGQLTASEIFSNTISVIELEHPYLLDTDLTLRPDLARLIFITMW